MTQQRDIERLLDHWLEIGPTEAADRVIDVVSDRIERQSQRPAWRLDWRPRVMNPVPRAVLVAAVAIVVVATSFIVIRSSTDPAAIGAPTPSPTSSTAVSATPSLGPTSPQPNEATKVPISPTPRPPRTVRSALRVPMSYSWGQGWTIYADTPTEVRLGFHPLTHTIRDEGDADPDVSIGMPYGFDSVSALLHFFKTVRYPDGGSPRDLCPMIAAPRRASLGGLSGYEFNCWTERNGDIAVYPRTRQGALAGIESASRESDDWFVIPSGGPFIDFLVVDIKGSPVIIAITGAEVTTSHNKGPLVAENLTLAPEPLAAVVSLQIDLSP